MWRAARFTSSYADPLTDESESDENNFEDGLDFNNQGDGDESIEGIRRRVSEEAAVSRVGEALNQTLGPDINENATPRDHFSPIQVRFPVNAPALRPPAAEAAAEEADMAQNFDAEDKVDGDKAADLARSIKIEFAVSDVKFWFVQLEDKMTMATVNSQWLKKTVLQRNLPTKQKEDVKELLSVQRVNAGRHIYLDIKTELLRIYAQKPQDAYRKALTRVMVGLPSQLGYQIVGDVCKKPTKLSGCCCASAVLALWSDKLPVGIRAHISNREFTKDTYKEVFEAADKVFLSSKQVSVSAIAGSAAVGQDLDETQSAFDLHNQPQQVAAVGGGKPRKPQRGNRGGGGGGGQNKPQGQQGQQKGQNQNQGQGGQSQNRPRGPRHASNPPESCCSRHYRHGADAWFCLAPLTCPWVNKCSARPT